MPRPTDRQLLRVCLRLYKDDYQKLQDVSDASGSPGVNLLIRSIVHSYVNQLTASERRNLDQIQIPDIQLPENLFSEDQDREPQNA